MNSWAVREVREMGPSPADNWAEKKGDNLPQTALQEYEPNKLECRLSESKPISQLKKFLPGCFSNISFFFRSHL